MNLIGGRSSYAPGLGSFNTVPVNVFGNIVSFMSPKCVASVMISSKRLLEWIQKKELSKEYLKFMAACIANKGHVVVELDRLTGEGTLVDLINRYTVPQYIIDSCHSEGIVRIYHIIIGMRKGECGEIRDCRIQLLFESIKKPPVTEEDVTMSDVETELEEAQKKLQMKVAQAYKRYAKPRTAKLISE